MRSKGFILTMDVMLALIVGMVLVTTILFLVYQPRNRLDDYLYEVALDVLTVSDKDGSALSALEGDASSLEDFIEDMPDNICLNFSVANETDHVFYSKTTGCATPTEYVVARRSIVNNSFFYIAKTEVWYR